MMKLDRGDFLKLAASATLTAATGAPLAAAADDLKQMHVLGVPTDGVKAILYAEKAGLFRKHGIDVDTVSTGSGAAIFAAVVGGTADAGSGRLFPVFAAFGRGLPLRMIAPASYYSSDHADSLLLVKKDSPIKTARDLNGKILGVDAIKDVYSVATQAWVTQQGGDGNSVRPVELKPTEQLSALDTGRIDAAVFKTPFVTVALDTGKFRVFGKPLDAIAPHFLLSCWVANEDYITKNPAIVSGFVAAMTEAAHYTNAHQAETVDLVASFTGQEPAQVAHAIRSISAESVTLADLQAPLDFALKYGIVTRGFDVSGLLAPGFPLAKGSRA
jgi:NitT/TauT family transport system substrate-binding protein